MSDNPFDRDKMMTSEDLQRVLRRSPRHIRYMAERGEIKIAIQGKGRGNHTVYAVPRKLLPAGFSHI